MPEDTVTPEAWVASLPAERRATITAVREVILRRLPSGYRERVASGMLVYEVPLERFPDTYNGQPLWYAGLASQKSYCSLHLMAAYAGPQRERLTRAFAAAGKRLDMGKACIRFRSADELPLDAIGDLIAELSVDRWIATYEASRAAASASRKK